MYRLSLAQRVLFTSLISLGVTIGLLLAAGPPVESSSPVAAEAVDDPAPQGILFLRGRGFDSALWLADVDGENTRKLADEVVEYDISPDGTKVVYTTQAIDLSGSMKLLEVESGATSDLAEAKDMLAIAPVWSPAGGIIAFERRTMTATGAGAPKIWLLAEDGASLGSIVPGGESVTYGAVWSRDGARIAAIEPTSNAIVIFNFTKQLRRVLANAGAGFDWSPDGKFLIMSVEEASDDGPEQKLVLYDLEQDTQTPLASAAGAADFTPRWSPDGRYITFVRRGEPHHNGEIWLIEVDDAGKLSEPRQLTNDPSFDNNDPQWSPDSSKLLWSRFPLGVGGTTPSVWLLDVNSRGAQPQLLIDDAIHARWRR